MQGGVGPASRRQGLGGLAYGQLVVYQTYSEGVSAKALIVGKILVNSREDQTVILQPYAASGVA